MNRLKKVIRVYEHGSAHWVGNGFPVRNLIPSSGLEREIDPFLMLDYAGPSKFEATSQLRGVGEHPHRGFETVTIAYQGSVQHRDSGGNSGKINPGDVQWMTAGSGVVHEEMHEREFAKQGGTFEMVQLWVNLPQAHKMIAPRYQTITAAQIPKLSLGAKDYARVIAGEAGGVKGPAHTFTPITILDIKMTSEKARLELPDTHNTAVFLLNGRVCINDYQIDGDAKLALLDTTGHIVSLSAYEDSRLLIISGQPIDEPVASYGPFVMNDESELQEAINDYKAGKMGKLSNS